MWACGPIGWRDENKGGKDEILDDIQKMSDLKIPFTGWWVDRPYSNGAEEWSKMDFNDKFANPEEWISTIRNKYGLQFMSWVGTLTFDDYDFPALLPGLPSYIDLTNPEGVKELGRRLHQYQYSVGVKGHKMDRADEFFPVTAHWYDKTPEPERRNKYIYLFAKTIDSLLRAEYNDDQFNFARSSYQRSQQYLSAVWGGDSRSSWDGMASNLANCIRCGFMGFPVWGFDVGGYLGGRISEKLYARWLELGTWCGLFEVKLDDAGGRGADRPPWRYSEQLQNIFEKSCSQRMELQPFIYSLANTSYKNGVMMKPLAYVYPDDKNTYGIWSEYQLGNTFLIAPILDSTDTRKVYLPKGKWYDFYESKKIIEGEKEITVTSTLDHIPVFVKANSIYVTGKMIDGNSKLWSPSENTNRVLNIFAFPGEAGEETFFDYVDYYDNNMEKLLSLNTTNDVINFSAPALSTDICMIIKMEKKPKSCTINGEEVQGFYDGAIDVYTFLMSKNTENIVKIVK
jgi:alpha-glucosidase (family GH31 glycosyl hydrolase)